MITGGGFTAVTDADEVLFVASISAAPDATVAVLLMLVPCGTSQLTFATRVAVTVVLTGSDARLIVRLLPEPPQTSPPVALHDTNVVVAGRLSVIVTLGTTVGTRFRTEIVYVTLLPVMTALVSADFVMVRSATGVSVASA